MKRASFNQKIRSLFSKTDFEKSAAKLCDSQNYYTLESFKQRLILERRRAERSDIQASIVIFAFKTNVRSQEKKFISQAKALLHIMCTNLRETDAITLYNSEKILILLPDTDLNGARYVCNILYKQLNTSLLKFDEEVRFGLKDLEIEILSFPEKTSKKKLEQILPTDHYHSKYNSVAVPGANINMSTIADVEKTSNPPVINTNGNNGAALVLDFVDTPFFDKQLLTQFFLRSQRVVKQVGDFLGAWLLLIVLLPFLLIISALIKLTSSGPVLYKQRRIGLRGKEFILYKFRSMYQNSDERIHQEYIKKLIAGKTDEINNGSAENPNFKLKDDPRITSIGKFIRKTSIDELPQLWNVIKGEMSLIGPRPPIPYEVEDYKTWHYRRIIEIKPGITGLWQIKGRNQTTFDEMVRYDIQYIKNWTLWLDIKIILATFGVFVNQSGS